MARTKPTDSAAPGADTNAPSSTTPAPTAPASSAADKPKSVNVNNKRHRIVKTAAMLWGVSVEAALSRIIDEWQAANGAALSAALTTHLGE